MKRFFLCACIWTPGALAAAGFVIVKETARRVEAGELSYMDGLYIITPWVWIPGFLLVPAMILGVLLVTKNKWTALAQLGASVCLVFAWIHFVDSGPALPRPSESRPAVPDAGE